MFIQMGSVSNIVVGTSKRAVVFNSRDSMSEHNQVRRIINDERERYGEHEDCTIPRLEPGNCFYYRGHEETKYIVDANVKPFVYAHIANMDQTVRPVVLVPYPWNAGIAHSDLS
jgi:hypothetical protein